MKHNNYVKGNIPNGVESCYDVEIFILNDIIFKLALIFIKRLFEVIK